MVTPSAFRFSFANATVVPRKISTPRTVLSHPEGSDGLRVPRSVLRVIRDCLRVVYPDLAEKPWAGTRMCWWVLLTTPHIFIVIVCLLRCGQSSVSALPETVRVRTPHPACSMLHVPPGPSSAKLLSEIPGLPCSLPGTVASVIFVTHRVSALDALRRKYRTRYVAKLTSLARFGHGT